MKIQLTKLVRHPTPQAENPRKNYVKSCFSTFFSMICWSKHIPKPLENPSDHFEPVSASLDHSQAILHRFYIFDFFLKNKSYIFWSVFEVSPIFSLFLELWRLWDHSQIVDLIFLNRMVSTRASESSKTPHSWQNNVPKRSTKYF